MLAPAILIDEAERLAALYKLNLLDTEDSEEFDSITRLACQEFNVDISAVSLLDSNRQWFKSITGLDVRETSRDVSFCGHTILEEGCFAVLDTLLDSRFDDNPLVTGEPHIRFYAGCPIHDPSFRRIGSLCLIDRTPRSFNREDLVRLHELANMIDAQIEHDYFANFPGV